MKDMTHREMIQAVETMFILGSVVGTVAVIGVFALLAQIRDAVRKGK
jgi:hypothetical protein